MARKVYSAVEFNFDGLTDCITNLAGSLILLVVIIFALTKPKEAGLNQPRFSQNKIGAEVPITPLVEKLQAIRRDTEIIQQETRQIEQHLPALVAEIEELERRGR